MKPGKRQTEPTASATTPGTDPPREAPATAPEQHRWLPLTSAPPGEATDQTKAVAPGSTADTSYKSLGAMRCSTWSQASRCWMWAAAVGDLLLLAELPQTHY
jgi:hypothetical protein